MLMTENKNIARVQFRVDLDAEVSRRFEAVFEDAGQTKVIASNRLFKWFVGSSDVIQRGILGALPPSIKVDIAKNALEAMAAGSAEDEANRRDAREDESAAHNAKQAPQRKKSGT